MWNGMNFGKSWRMIQMILHPQDDLQMGKLGIFLKF